eukprot:CAMPEP_0206238638 /NCGR_PEP_ID=MMETSP0047_2-20121206/14926_1 /ASSEMBLY_ACC=CAM_ASM_000192 /TAXON_ID=195065 /ORGANISM="Chroomonas mesostigmatica_cf, Strain CCMP1168" /LENGTH=287 /DNA_ID=CAMNT_0053663195 /DNA_START=200 /DNA_END=1059 /DNA_ORIENTATION=-
MTTQHWLCFLAVLCNLLPSLHAQRLHACSPRAGMRLYMTTQHWLSRSFLAVLYDFRLCMPRVEAPVLAICGHASLHDDAALVVLLGRLVELLALHAQRVALVDEVVELLAASEHRVDRVVEDLLGLLEVLLDFRDLVSLSRVLELLQGLFQAREGHAVVRLLLADLAPCVLVEVVEELCDDPKSNALRVLAVRHAHPRDAIVLADDVDVVTLMLQALVVPRVRFSHARPDHKGCDLLDGPPLEEAEGAEVHSVGQVHRLLDARVLMLPPRDREGVELHRGRPRASAP